MFHVEPRPDRWKLGFKEAVLGSFKFLRRYGFRCVRAEPTFVRYETMWFLLRRKLFVNVYHGRASHEMGVEIGPREREQEMIPLPWIVKWAGGKEAEDFEKRTMFQVSSREGVQQLVPRMAELVRKYASPFLRGDPEAYRSANEEIRRSSARYLREMDLRRMQEKAEAAWHAKDYAQVVSLYEPFQEDLTRSQAMRLEYARKQLPSPEVVAADTSTQKGR